MFQDHGHNTGYVIAGLEEKDIVLILYGVGFPAAEAECEVIVLEVNDHYVVTSGPTLYLADNGGFIRTGRMQ